MEYWETVGIEYLKRNNITFNTEKDNYILQVGIKQFSDFCNKEYGGNIWQRYFNDHIIRNREDYEEHLRYINENPLRWYYDELY
jgi:REP element-mobilizing transposase RayT